MLLCFLGISLHSFCHGDHHARGGATFARTKLSEVPPATSEQGKFIVDDSLVRLLLFATLHAFCPRRRSEQGARKKADDRRRDPEGFLHWELDDMRVLTDMPPYRRAFRVPAGVYLRECSVVIIGSTCKICGRDFKCESDVALHKQWRHLSIGPLIGILESNFPAKNAGRKCNICDMYLESVSDWRMHKRQVHRHRRRPRRGTVRVRFKLDGITMTDVTLDRKYLKVQSVLRYFVDVGTQTESLENEKHQDNCARNIDLPLLPGHAVDNATQYNVEPHKAANRYIVGKFTSTTHPTVMVGRSLAEISNTPYTDAISGNDGSYEKTKREPCDCASRDNKPDALIASLADDVNIQNKENSRTINVRERRSVYCQSEILILEDFEAPPACQTDKNIMSPRKQNFGSSESLCRTSAKQPNENATIKLSTKYTNSLVDVMDIDVYENNNNNNNNNNIDDVRVMMKRSSAPFQLTDKNESAKVNTNVDDDVQEVLRITRGNLQNDINHESPNRTEREILVQMPNEMRVSSTHRGSNVSTGKRGAELIAIEPTNYSSFTSIAKDGYWFLANTLNKKLGISMEDLQHYGINYYNDLPEINNNLEEYTTYAHEDFLPEPSVGRQVEGSQHIDELRTNDNVQMTVHLD